MTTQSRSFTPDLLDAASAAPNAVAGARIAGLIAQAFRLAHNRLRIWNMRLDDRAFLADLHDHQLGDIGMTRDQRDREVRKPFWKA